MVLGEFFFIFFFFLFFFFIRNNLFLDFNETALDDSYESNFWLKLNHKTSNVCIFPCVCYLPPEISSRHLDAKSFLLIFCYQII